MDVYRYLSVCSAFHCRTNWRHSPYYIHVPQRWPHQFTTRITNVLFVRVLILVPPFSFKIFPLNYSLVKKQPSPTTVIVSSSTLTKWTSFSVEKICKILISQETRTQVQKDKQNHLPTLIFPILWHILAQIKPIAEGFLSLIQIIKKGYWVCLLWLSWDKSRRKFTTNTQA